MPEPKKSQSSGLIPMELNPSEANLITLIRRLMFGTIEKIGVQNGLPVVIAGGVNQRVDLTKEDEVSKILKQVI